MSIYTDMVQLQNIFTGVMNSISNSANLAISALQNLNGSSISQPRGWQSSTGPEIFTNSGMARFEQEVQSANDMLTNLKTAQNTIINRAAQTNLLPPAAITDMNNMQERLKAIQQRIWAIQDNRESMGTNAANTELEQLRGQLNRALQEQQGLSRAISNMDLQAANAAYLQLSQTVGNTEISIRDSIDEQERLNQAIEKGATHSSKVMSAVKGLVSKYATLDTMKNVMNLSDTVTQKATRLSMIVDDNGSVEDLQQKIYASAQASRSSYFSTMDAVSELGIVAGDAFSNQDEMITFVEQANKQFALAGMETPDMDATMSQLIEAMGSGTLNAEGFESLSQQAPNMIQTIADYMGVPEEKLGDLAEKGQITANILKAAMFTAAGQTNEKFEQLPNTFSQIWTSIQNAGLMAFQPVLERLNELASSTMFQNMVNGIIEAIAMAAEIVLGIFDLIAAVGSFIAENWSIIEPIIMGIVIALGLYYGAMLLYNTINGISTAITAAKTFAQKVHAASLAMQTGTTFKATVAQNGFNTALLACPITWIVLGIIAVVAALFALCNWIAKTTGAAQTGFGIITGGINVVIQAVWNAMLVVANVAIGIWDALGACCYNIGTAFYNVVAHIKGWFYSLLSTVLTVIGNICAALNKLPFIEFDYSGVTDKAEEYAAKSKKAHESVKEYKSITDAFNKGFHTFDTFQEGWASEAFHAGAAWGDSIANKFSNLFGKDKEPSPEREEHFEDSGRGAGGIGDSGIGADGIGDNVDNIAGNTESIADGMEITEEDLKYLRDIAEQETINRFTTAEIVIEQTNHNTVSGKMDLDGIVSGLTDAANEAVFMIAEGVHI